MLATSINEDEVPFEEGWVKLRGFTPTVTKQQIVEFLRVRPACLHHHPAATHACLL